MQYDSSAIRNSTLNKSRQNPRDYRISSSHLSDPSNPVAARAHVLELFYYVIDCVPCSYV